MLKKYFLIVIILFPFICFSQKSELDSINSNIEKAKSNYGEKRIFFLERASNFTQKANIDSLIKKVNIEYGLQSYYNGLDNHLIKANKRLLILYEKSLDSSTLAKHFHFKALEQKIKLNVDSAFYYYHQSKNISIKITDSLAVGRRLLSIANLQREAKDYLGSEINSIEALKYLEPLKSYKYLESIYNNLAIVSRNLEDYKSSEKYFNKAIYSNEKNNFSRRKNTSFLYIMNGIGLSYQKQNQHSKAITYFKKGLRQDSIKQKYPIQYAFLLENLAASNFLLGNKTNVLEQYNEVLSIREKLNNKKELSITHINLSDYYKDLKQNKKALFHSNQALKHAKQTHNNKRWLEALENLSELTIGEQSKQYLQEYIKLNDSLFQKERLLKNQFAKIRYETDKKEKENTVLKTDNEKKQAEITYQKQQKTIGWLAAASSILLFGLSIMFFVQRRRKLLYQAQLERVQVREHERQQIAKSLHDEVAGDLRLLHQKLEKSNLLEEAKKLNTVKDNVRNLSHQLSSVSFDKVSFKDQIINLVSDYFELDFRITVTGLQEYEWETINDAIKRLLYLSTRESIQNSKKYAEASKLTIDFTLEKKYVHLNITDNGIGFDTNVSKKGIGLQNLQERVEELNGTLQIDSEVGNGTKTNIQIPLNA